MVNNGRITRRRLAQSKTVQFFAATGGLIEISKGTDGVTRQAAKDFSLAVYSMFLYDQRIDLKHKSLEEGTYLLFDYLQSQTLNDYIEPQMGLFYGQALAQAVIDLDYHNELVNPGFEWCIKSIRLVV